MNNKTIALILAIIAIALLAIFLMTNRDGDTTTIPAGNGQEVGAGGETGDEANLTEQTAHGTVVNVDTAQVIFDKPYVIEIEDANGARTTIAIPSSSINLCLAKNSITDPTTIGVGMVVEARGVVESNDVIVPCVRENHYLRVVSSN